MRQDILNNIYSNILSTERIGRVIIDDFASRKARVVYLVSGFILFHIFQVDKRPMQANIGFSFLP